MTAPRQVLPGVSYLITRRCLQRQLLLRPGALVNQIFAYVLAVAASRYGIQLHAFCVLSNHYHLVLTDPNAQLPAFQQYLDGFVARAVNASLGRRETFWAPHSYSAVTLGSAADVVSKAAYALANPVAAGLVPAGHLWPGLWSLRDAPDGAKRVRRPDRFFDPDGDLPEFADLTLHAPPSFGSLAAFQAQLRTELSRQEEAARRMCRAFLGAERVLKQSPFSHPSTAEPRRRFSPRVAARDRWRRVELLQRLKAFLEDYREALARWRERSADVIFPAGTYLMRVAHGVPCRASP